MSTKHYFELVSVLARMDTFELADVAIKLAQVDPQKFLSIVNFETYQEVIVRAINEVRITNPSTSGKIYAIRALRSNCNLGLKEAKLMVEEVMDEFEHLLTPVVPYES